MPETAAGRSSESVACRKSSRRSDRRRSGLEIQSGGPSTLSRDRPRFPRDRARPAARREDALAQEPPWPRIGPGVESNRRPTLPSWRRHRARGGRDAPETGRGKRTLRRSPVHLPPAPRICDLIYRRDASFLTQRARTRRGIRIKDAFVLAGLTLRSSTQLQRWRAAGQCR